MLARLIRLYQRFLSGRGPLRAVRCTFERTESCSVYGRRLAEDPSVPGWRAVWLIARRLRACRGSALYVDAGGLVWGPDFDRLSPAEHAARLDRALESEATRAAVCRAHLDIAGHCSDPGRVPPEAARRALSRAPGSRLLLRTLDARRARGRAWRRAGRGLLVYAVVVGALLGGAGLTWATGAITVGAALAASSLVRRETTELERLEALMAANRFARPGRRRADQPPPSTTSATRMPSIALDTIPPA